MNSSIVSLRLSSFLRCPLISRQGRVTMSKVTALNFFSTFIFNPKNLVIGSCSFYKFLHTSIVIDGDYTGNYTTRPSQPSSSNLNIYDAVFQNCGSSSAGGAIYYSGGTLNVTRAMFIQCYTLATADFGGALDVIATSLSFTYCCGYGCYAYFAGQLMKAILSSSSSTQSIFVNFTTTVICSPSRSNSSLESLILNYGYEYIWNCNASHNSVSGARSAYAFDTSLTGDIRFCTINSNVGITCVRLKASTTQTAEYCNFLNNSVDSSGGLLEIYGTATITGCSFMGNNGTFIGYGTGSATLYSCVLSGTDSGFTSIVMYNCSTGVSTLHFTAMSEMITYLCNHTFVTSRFTEMRSLRMKSGQFLWTLVTFISE